MAYQGKFSAKNRQSRSYEAEPQVTSRRAEAPKREAPAPAPTPARPQRRDTQEEAPQKRPVDAAPRKSGSKKKKKKANRTVTTIFYTVYFLVIIGFFGGMFFVTEWLDDWLINYEASQPTNKCEQVFSSLFDDPDWAAIYEASGIADSGFEGVDAFVTYMSEKTEGKDITYAETSAGLSGGRKYLILVGDETIGHFTLVDKSANRTDLPDWQLGEVVMTADRSGTILIQSQEGHTVSVNGVTLDERYVIQKSSNKAVDYLPDTTGVRKYLMQVSGLMADPTIVITDADGNPSTVVYNEETGVYEEQAFSSTMGPEEKERALLTAETYSMYMGTKSQGSNLSRYFDTTTATYKSITTWERHWVQEGKSYRFENETVSDYARYSDDLFSVHVKLSLIVTRGDGSERPYDVDSTFFFQKQGSNWKCINMTNEDIQEIVASVRLTFMDGDTELSSNFYDSPSEIITPTLTAPEGKVFAGWYTINEKADGTTSYDLVFAADESGKVTVPTNMTLKPMTLYPLFEDADGGAA